jgi:hypothetical protein
MRKTITIVLSLALVGCATTGEAPLGAKPVSYAPAVRAYIQQTFFDPAAVRDAQISEPFVANTYWSDISLPSSAWAVCLRANGKNRFGAYTGAQFTLLKIEDGRVTAALNDARYGAYEGMGQAHQNCPDRAYKPL